MAKKKQKRIAVFDFETDPFLYNRTPEPFACGFFDGDEYQEFWGDDCVQQFLKFLEGCENDYYLFAHNGGKFDFIYFVRSKSISNPVKIINSRIVSAKLGRHILRDSYAFLPVPLAVHDKGEIDYRLFERDKRDANKADILEYLARDCESLFKFVSAFIDRFGIQLTIGGTAIKELQKFHPFERTDEEHDEIFRPYYFGGRVECFKTGEILGVKKVFDVNSMYPYVMSKCQHPTGSDYWELETDEFNFDENGDVIGYPGKPFFIAFKGTQKGAFPVRTKTGLDFNIGDSDSAPDGIFYTMSHEFKIAKKYGLVSVREIVSIFIPCEIINFFEFIDANIHEKIAGKKLLDKVRELFAKLLMNSSYGKFGQNPDSFKDYYFRYPGEPYPQGEWELDDDFDGVELFTRPSLNRSYYDVATASSVTSAARAVLLEALQLAKGVIYCDTDSICCESFDGKIDPYELGAWDLEATIDKAYIAGKKLYAFYGWGIDKKTKEKFYGCLKLASKGVRLQGDDIIKLCRGEVYHYKREAPNFKINGDAVFLHRSVKMLDKNKLHEIQ